MMFTDLSITILRKDARESDIMAVLYTKTRGKMIARFPGVKKHHGKLKAVAEMFTLSDIRCYLKPGAVIACATGGKHISVFPNIRKDTDAVSLAFYFCQILHKMTPLHQPSVEKFDLLSDALSALEQGARGDILKTAFILRLMQYAGYGLKTAVLGIPQEFWDEINNMNFRQLSELERETEHCAKAANVAERFLKSHFGKVV